MPDFSISSIKLLLHETIKIILSVMGLILLLNGPLTTAWPHISSLHLPPSILSCNIFGDILQQKTGALIILTHHILNIALSVWSIGTWCNQLGHNNLQLESYAQSYVRYSTVKMLSLVKIFLHIVISINIQ